jgi:hypothetical protein
LPGTALSFLGDARTYQGRSTAPLRQRERDLAIESVALCLGSPSTLAHVRVSRPKIAFELLDELVRGGV